MLIIFISTLSLILISKLVYKGVCIYLKVKPSDQYSKKKKSVLNKEYAFVTPTDSHDGFTSNPDGF